MGEGDSSEGSEEDSNTSNSVNSNENKQQPSENSTNSQTEDAKQTTPEKTNETIQNQTSDDKKDNVDNLRRVIKVNGDGQAEEKKVEDSATEPEKKIEDKTSNQDPVSSAEIPGDSKAALEQKRQILQSIKDFDFQIKKNQETISKLNEKIDGLTKDLDDLVSLYEIVSEQMNPFVGLSKVTKKRIDALENFTHEIEDMKTRMGDIESELEKGLGGLKRIRKNSDTNIDKSSPTNSDKKDDSEFVKTTVPKEETTDLSSIPSSGEFKSKEYSNNDIDMILSKSLESFLIDQNIDNMIDEFLLNLK
jgi:flagellar protein FlaC